MIGTTLEELIHDFINQAILNGYEITGISVKNQDFVDMLGRARLIQPLPNPMPTKMKLMYSKGHVTISSEAAK